MPFFLDFVYSKEIDLQIGCMVWFLADFDLSWVQNPRISPIIVEIVPVKHGWKSEVIIHAAVGDFACPDGKSCFLTIELFRKGKFKICVKSYCIIKENLRDVWFN